MIMMSVICRLMYASYDRWPIVVHISAPNTERTHHDQASSYKELCKGRATELYKLLLKLYQRKLFSTLSSTFFIILCVYHLSEYLLLLMFCSDINKSITQVIVILNRASSIDKHIQKSQITCLSLLLRESCP